MLQDSSDGLYFSAALTKVSGLPGGDFAKLIASRAASAKYKLLPFFQHQANRIAPAANWRRPALISGGMVSSAKRIARNVEPQMR